MRLLGRMLAALIGVALPLAAAEALSWVYLNQLAANPRPLAVRNVPWHVYDAYRNHALGPGWRSGRAAHNAQGFRRSGDVAREKPGGTYRIFLLGGSAAYGLGAAPPFPRVEIGNEQTIDYKLEHALAPLYPQRRVEVINAAVTAYWTHHHLIQLHERLLDYDPDLIIFFDGINDYYHADPGHRQFDSYRYSMVLKVDAINHPSALDVAHTLLDWGKQHSNAAFVLSGAADRFLRWNEPPDPTTLDTDGGDAPDAAFLRRYEEISRRTWVRTLRSVLLTLTDARVAALTTLQPELVFEQTAGVSEGDRRLREIELARRPPGYLERKRAMRPVARRLAGDTARELGATFVDLTDVFDDRAQYFVDYCHLSEAGAARIAERLLPHVRAIIDGAPA